MKTKIILVALVCSFSAFKMSSQPNTGQTTYSHVGVTPILSSGSFVMTKPGFILAGYIPTVSSGPNLVIDKVDVDGIFNSTPGEFAKQYTISTGGTSCNISLTQATNCVGVSIIETFQGNDHYAMTAAFEEGLIVCFLNSLGDPTTSKFYPFPVSQNFLKSAIITESSLNNGNYYIAGAYNDNNRDYLYVIKTDLNFSTGWSAKYDIGNATTFIPKSIIESTFNVATGEVIVVGVLSGLANAADGFFLALDDATNGTVNNFYRYYYTGLSTEYFNSVQLSNHNSGYIVGGVANNTLTTGRAWMSNLSATGGINWSSQIDFTNDNGAGEVCSVIERYSSSNSAYEYYGTATSTVGMAVCKLDDTGTAFTAVTTTNNEFFYTTTAADQPCSITYFNTPADPNEGIHVFGNTNGSTNEYYLVQACFNGPSGDLPGTFQNVTGLANVISGPSNSSTVGISISSGLNPCSYFNIQNSSLTVIPAQTPTYLTGSWPSNPYTGSNAKLANTNDLISFENDDKQLLLYPNPVQESIFVLLENIEIKDLSLEILNNSGQVIFSSQLVNAELKTLELDLRPLGLKTGVYLLKLIGPNAMKKVKFNWVGL